MSRLTKHRILQGLILAAGCIGCAVFSLPAAGILLLTGIVLAVIEHFGERRRRAEILHLCDDLDLILRGTEKVELTRYQEGELSILSAEIGKLTVRLREQNLALCHDRQFLKESLEDMSHQLRTPLTTSMLLLGRLRKPDLTRHERAEHVQELFSMLSRMQWMIETLLGLSRLDAGTVTFRPEVLSLREVVRDALEPLEISLELADITVETFYEDDPQFTADRGFLIEALTNILKNCMEHTPAGGRIRIEGTENSIYTGLTITDTGSGIAQEDLPHIFERFYRGNSMNTSGYGIGLAFARKIVASQNGSLQVRNAQPHGAQFDLRIYRSVV